MAAQQYFKFWINDAPVVPLEVDGDFNYWMSNAPIITPLGALVYAQQTIEVGSRGNNSVAIQSKIPGNQSILIINGNI